MAGTPLPADLPENWQTGQIVAPSGGAVGLTEQHGYNYLMHQVNATQAAVNELNTASSGTDEEIASMQASLQTTNNNLAALTTKVGNVETTANAALPKSGGAMTGTLSGVNSSQVRNIAAGTTDMTAGTTDLTTGELYVMYE